MTTIAVIGCGAMGAAVARRLSENRRPGPVFAKGRSAASRARAAELG